MSHELVEVVRERIVVVAGGRLARLPKSSTIVRDYAETRVQQDGHLLLPRGSAQGVSVDQDDGLPHPMVLVVEIDSRRIFFTDAYEGHFWSPTITHTVHLINGQVIKRV